MDRGVPEPGQLLVELEHGQRGAGHLERCDVAADEVAHGLEAGGAELLVDLAIEKVKLEQRGAAHPVDEGEDLGPFLRLEVGDDRFHHHVDDLAGGPELRPAATRLSVDADAELDLPFRQLKDRLARRRRYA